METPIPKGASVERMGVHSETVTFLDESGRAIFGCDNSEGPRERTAAGAEERTAS